MRRPQLRETSGVRVELSRRARVLRFCGSLMQVAAAFRMRGYHCSCSCSFGAGTSGSALGPSASSWSEDTRQAKRRAKQALRAVRPPPGGLPRRAGRLTGRRPEPGLRPRGGHAGRGWSGGRGAAATCRTAEVPRRTVTIPDAVAVASVRGLPGRGGLNALDSAAGLKRRADDWEQGLRGLAQSSVWLVLFVTETCSLDAWSPGSWSSPTLPHRCS